MEALYGLLLPFLGESSRRGRFCLRFYSRDAKSAMASEIFSC